MYRVFGIRHHGPGSALRLREALRHFAPDLVLIEGPPEANTLLAQTDFQALVPPVALLLYNPKELKQASFYPFAAFSPEWIAMQYAQESQRETRMIDLSPGARLQSEAAAYFRDRQDPLARIAEMTGYPDGESWWDAIVEGSREQEDHFEALGQLMAGVRQQSQDTEEKILWNQRREAFMRKQIRLAIKEGFEKIAVVCGAFHAPALTHLPPLKGDTALLKGLKITALRATWIPWTYQRLATQSGYGAGVQSPAWYDMIFHYPASQRVQVWMSEAAQQLRKAGMDSSPAQVIDGIRLAQQLATLRGRQQAGLEELLDAVPSVFHSGDFQVAELVRQKLVIGEKMGQVPSDSPSYPLQKDIQTQQKSLRLKPVAEKQEIHLDLRKEFDLRKSVFLHRMSLLEIHWARLIPVRNHEGTFRESWQLQWRPECELQIVEAAPLGNTLARASLAGMKNRLAQGGKLKDTIAHLDLVLLAQLEELLPLLEEQLQRQSALSTDVRIMLESVPLLLKVLRYGDVRNTEQGLIVSVLQNLLPRLFLSLPEACRFVEPSHTDELFGLLQGVHPHLALLDKHPVLGTLWQDWLRCLQGLSQQTRVSPKIRGWTARILFDNRQWPASQLSLEMNQMLSPGVPIQAGADWVEGLLFGSGLLLIHHPPLFVLLDTWIAGMDEGQFQAQLAILRRTFARFSPSERRKMGELARRHEDVEDAITSSAYDPVRGEQVVPILKLLLGLE